MGSEMCIRDSPTAPAVVEKKTESVIEAPAEAAVIPPSAVALTAANAASIWQQALDSMGDMAADMGRLATKVATSGPNRLAVSFPAGYSAQKDFCERPTTRPRFENALQQITGQTIRLEFELLAGAPNAVETRVAAPTSKRQLIKDRERHPLIQQAMELFQAEMVDVVEGRRG